MRGLCYLELRRYTQYIISSTRRQYEIKSKAAISLTLDLHCKACSCIVLFRIVILFEDIARVAIGSVYRVSTTLALYVSACVTFCIASAVPETSCLILSDYVTPRVNE